MPDEPESARNAPLHAVQRVCDKNDPIMDQHDKEAFRVNTTLPRQLRRCKERIAYRLRPIRWKEQARPMLSARNLHYEMADRASAFAHGGIGAMHDLARKVGLIRALDENLHLLKRHLPYYESDHVLNMAYNLLCEGECLEDIEEHRNDEVYLDALGAQRIPDPTTEGDFCRRFEVQDVETLMDIINDVRVRVWRQQPDAFFDLATIDADGTIADTWGQCKAGMDLSYKGIWGYHPLLLSLAQTGEPLVLVNRPGNSISSEGAAERFDQGIELCRSAGFRRILLRGDTDFSQTRHLDRWDGQAVDFVFGMDARANLKALAEGIPEAHWTPYVRPAKYEVHTPPRRRPENVKERIVVEREFKNIRLESEQVAEFAYRPIACRQDYRVVVLRKNLSIERGEQVLFDEIRYFFYITNISDASAVEVVELAHGRCNQENLIEQLKDGVQAMRMPVDNLVSNWAYMVMASLAWTLKGWFALLLPQTGRWAEKHRQEKQTVLQMEFKRFRRMFIGLVCQVVRTGRRMVYRLLSWNPWLEVFLRAFRAIQRPLRC